MKKIEFLFPLLCLLMMASLPALAAGPDHKQVEAYVNFVNRKMCDEDIAEAMKRDLVLKPISMKKLSTLEYPKSGVLYIYDDMAENLAHGLSDENYERTHALALAISIAKPHLVKRFLAVIRDIDDECLLVQGHKQKYTPVQLAMDFTYPCFNTIPLTERVEVLHVLGVKGFDFNKVLTDSSYQYTPVSCGEHRGHGWWYPYGKYINQEGINRLRGCAALYGAILTNHNGGKFGEGIRADDLTQALNFAFDMYRDADAERRQHFKLSDDVKEKFVEIRDQRQAALADMAF